MSAPAGRDGGPSARILGVMRFLQATVVALSLLVAAPLFAQQKPKPKEKPRAEQGDKNKVKAATKTADWPKDDALTAKDPVIVAIDKFRKAKVAGKGPDWRTTLPAPPAVVFDRKHEYRWHLETSVGTLVVTLLPEAAPKHVASVVYLSRCGFYDDLCFPRVLKGFMAQGGSPNNTQSGNAGYSLDGEFLTGQKHDKPGALSAANSGEPNSDGSQFFLTFVPTPHLDGKHTVHGFVTEGLAVLQEIEKRGVEKDGEPLPEKVTIVHTWITVVAKPPAAPGEPVTQPAK